MSIAAAVGMGPLAEAQDSEQSASTASSRSREPTFGGPDQVDNQIANDEASTSRIIRERLLDPYFAWKKNLQEKRGISLSVDYSAAYRRWNNNTGDDSAGVGIARF